MALPCRHQEDDTNVDVHSVAGTPLRYVSLDHVYSATSPCVSASGSSNVMSKKVKARKLMMVNHFEDDGDDQKETTMTMTTTSVCDKSPPIRVYSRRRKKPRHLSESSSFYDSLMARTEGACEVAVVDGGGEDSKVGRLLEKKKRKLGIGELVKLGIDENVLSSLDRPRLRDCRNYNNNSNGGTLQKRKKRNSTKNCEKVLSDSPATKRWVR